MSAAVGASIAVREDHLEQPSAIDRRIDELVAAAPEFGPEQASRIAVLLGGVA